MKRQKQTKTLTISLPENFYRGLEQAALDQDRSKNYLIKKAVENYLEDLFFSKRAEEILAENESNVSLEEVMEKYGLLEKYELSNKFREKSGEKSQ